MQLLFHGGVPKAYKTTLTFKTIVRGCGIHA